LFNYLDEELDPKFSAVKRTKTVRGIPDILINNQLVLELKVDPIKTERDRLIGQCCEYSRSFVAWAIVIDLDEDSVEKLLGLLEAKSLNYIEVIPTIATRRMRKTTRMTKRTKRIRVVIR